MSDWTSAQKKHAEVQQKQMEAQLASNLETERKGERFVLIEPRSLAAYGRILLLRDRQVLAGLCL
jgi:hypothetical protein